MKHTILTIEDQPDIRRLIRMTLEFKGFQVIEASDGAHGLTMARSSKPDLVLLDVMMAGMDGLTVARKMKAEPALASIPVVMLSALGQSSDVSAGLDTGVQGYLVKPFSPRELLALVERLLVGAPKSSFA